MERHLRVILAADMVGYSRLMEADDIGTLQTQKSHRREIIDPAFKKYNARLFKELGDGILAEFPSVVEAVQCAVDIQRELRALQSDAPSKTSIAYRIGINLGDVIFDDGDVFGDGVNVASRLEALADPGGICISGTVFDHLKSHIDAGFEPLGDVKVKNIERPVRAYKVIAGSSGYQSKPAVGIGRKNINLLAVALAAATLAGGLYFTMGMVSNVQHNPTPEASPITPNVREDPSIAVIPFENLSPDPDQVYFADGLAEDIITDLSKISGLFVIARDTSFQYRDQRMKGTEIGNELGVRFVLQGSVRRSKDRVRINAQLVDAKTSAEIWADRYDGGTSDIFQLQDRVTAEILGALRLKLTNQQQAAVDRHETENSEAYDAYLRGLRLISERRRLDVTRNEEAQAAFEEAIRLDPNYSSAYAGLGWAKWLLVEQVDVFNQKSRGNAFDLARKSIEISDNALARRTLAREHLSILNYWVETTRNIEAALVELERAYELQPNNPDILADLALALSFAGQPQRALEISREAMERNPSHPGWYFAASGIAHLLIGDPDRAVADLEKWVESDQIYNVPYLFLASAQALTGEEAIANASLHRFERLSLTIGTDEELGPGPFEISTSAYAIQRRWPMADAERRIFLDGLQRAGMKVPDG